MSEEIQSQQQKSEQESLSDRFEARREAIQKLREEGQIPYKSKYSITHTTAAAHELPDEETVAIAGRVILWRTFGSLVFAHLQDRSGTIQFSLNKKLLTPEVFKKYSKEVAIGDFIGISGTLWTTKTGERTVQVSSMEVLTKAVRTLPDKWAGVADPEIKQRKRYLDLLTSDESRKRFQVRSKLISFIRNFLDSHDFLEVETPILQAEACGASAKPFITKHNTLDRDFYLRISPETYLKRLVAGSFERVYELGRNFRNEGMDSSHLQEFTMLEWYAAYWNYEDNMRFIQELIQRAIQEFCGTLVIEYQGTTLDFSGDWERIDYREAVLERTGIDLRKIRTVEALKDAIHTHQLDVDVEGQVSYGGLVDLLYKRTVRPHLIQPVFLMNHPTELVPLARCNDEDPTHLDMFQVVVNTSEIVKAYSELVDPIEQRKRLEEQMALRQAGDEESMMLEEDFLECMEYGMPPISGLGLGIDRLVALMTDSQTLRDVVLFPTMREQGR